MPTNYLLDAPVLKNARSEAANTYGDKHFYQLPQNLISIIMNELSGKEGNQLKLMIALIGSIDTSGKGAKSFKIPEALIVQRCGMAASRYREARQALIKRGWIKHTARKEIEILYDNIYKQQEKQKIEKPIVQSEPKNTTETLENQAARAKAIGVSIVEYREIEKMRKQPTFEF